MVLVLLQALKRACPRLSWERSFSSCVPAKGLLILLCHRPAPSSHRSKHHFLDIVRPRHGRAAVRIGRDIRRRTMNENKNFVDKTAKAARETFEKGSAATQQSARGAQESFSAVAEGIRDFNVRLMEMAQLNTVAALDFCSRDVNRKGASRRCGALVVACSEAIRDAERAVQGTDGPGAENRNVERRADNAQLWSSVTRVLLNASLLTGGKQSSGAYHTPEPRGLGRQERALLVDRL